MSSKKVISYNNLTGKILVATPQMADEYFVCSLVYVLAHSASGAVGIIFNNKLKDINSDTLFRSLDIKLGKKSPVFPLFLGGPVDVQRGFIMHNSDFYTNSLYTTQDNISVSSNLEILQKIASGKGPSRKLFFLGYSSWLPSQLESEIEQNMWLIMDTNIDFIFEDNHLNKWTKALDCIGIKPYNISPYIGHA